MSMKVHNAATLDSALAASAYLKTAEGLVEELSKLLGRVAYEVGMAVDIGEHLSLFEDEIVAAADEINGAIKDYAQGG